MVSSSLWNNLSPSGKTKVKDRLITSSTPKGFNSTFRKTLGINLSNEVRKEEVATELKESIKNFFDRDDVARVWPDVKRMIRNPENKDEKVPARFRLGTIAALHERDLYLNNCVP